MTDVSEHETELVRKGDYRKQPRVDLSVSRHPVRIHDFLEGTRKVI